MGDSDHLDLILEHSYHEQTSQGGLAVRHRSFDEAANKERVTASFCSLPNGPQPQQPLPLHPLLQFVRSHNTPRPLHRNHNVPTVIVSPHSQSPTLDRDHTHVIAKKQHTKPPQSRQKLDGNKVERKAVHRGDSPMTTHPVATMGGSKEEGTPYTLPQRPPVISHHSSSVPSTPHQYPRQFASRSRSPSPNAGLGSHSPRSVSSEANGPHPTLRKAQARQGCKFETNVAFGKRRMPYTSSDILEKAKNEPKKALDPHEDDKLSGDMRELYDRLLPTKESEARRSAFVKKLENILYTEWPGNEFKVHVFGSSGNMLYTSESDVDICIQTPMRDLEDMHRLAAALAKHGMEKVVCVPSAKVPIVKIWDPELKLASDMNVNNTLALENTRMIKTYVQVDERVRPLAMIIKYWTKQRILNDAALGGTISSYTWICMILNFLQTRDPPILPALHQLPYRTANKETGVTSQFADNLDKLREWSKERNNKESVGQLLFHFFRRYGHEIDYENNVVSVRHGRLLSRKEKGWALDSLTKEARNRLCVEEPFNTERNLGNSADDFAWRGIHLELRRTFDLLADGGQLEKACEQYEFPPEEKIVFKKPTPSVKPVLTASSSSAGRNGRGGPGHRGGRANFNAKGSHAYGRRASSGAAFGNNRPPFLSSPPITGSIQEYFARGPNHNEQLHNELLQHYQYLEAQSKFLEAHSNNIKAQLAAQQRAQVAQQHQQQLQYAQMHAQAQAQIIAQAQAQLLQVQSRAQNANGSPLKSPFVTGRSSPRGSDMIPATAPLPQGYIYPYPGYYEQMQAMSTSASQDGSRTNPSSPSLANSIPSLRRAAHRSSTASENGATRSHSQPARGGVPPNAVPQGYAAMPYMDPQGFAGYPIARSSPQDTSSQQTAAEVPYSPPTAYSETAVSSDHTTPKEYPKEYVGYYVGHSPQMHAQPQDYSVPQIPSFNELRRRRVSPEIMQPLLNTALRRVSRSPSPLGGHMRSYSTTGAMSSSGLREQRTEPSRPPEDDGFVIVNGSYPTKPRETRALSESVDSLSSNTAGTDMSNPSALGIYVSGSEHYPMTAEQRQQQLYADELLQRHTEAELRKSSLTNGVDNHSPVDPSGLSQVPSQRQPFPQLPDALLNHYGALNGGGANHSTEVSPTRGQAQQWRPNPYPPNGLSVIDTLNAPRAPPQEIKSATLPLLSPVFETRTPSPTANRQHDLHKPQLPNGINLNAKENSHQLAPRRASVATSAQSTAKENHRANAQKKDSSTHEKAGKTSTNSHQGSNWQQPNNKRRNKKSKSANQKQGNESRSQGEPLPANEADRKGG